MSLSTPLDALAASLGASDVVHEMLLRHADVPGCSVALIDDYRVADFAVGRARQSTGAAHVQSVIVASVSLILYAFLVNLHALCDNVSRPVRACSVCCLSVCVDPQSILLLLLFYHSQSFASSTVRILHIVSLLHASAGEPLTTAHCMQIASESKTVAAAFATQYFAGKGIAMSAPVNALLAAAGSKWRIELPPAGAPPSDNATAADPTELDPAWPDQVCVRVRWGCVYVSAMQKSV